jgi:predicted outer membrane repeat protein
MFSIVGSVFEGNDMTGMGGAVRIEWARGYPYWMMFSATSNDFISNTASAFGGAFFANTPTQPIAAFQQWTFASCKFVGNTAGENGGATSTLFSSVHPMDFSFQQSQFVCNSAAGDAGAVNAPSTNGKLMIMGSIFRGNTAGRGGGAVYVVNPRGWSSAHPYDLQVTQSVFENNTAGQSGGALSGNLYAVSCDYGFLSPAGAIWKIQSSTFRYNFASVSGAAVEMMDLFYLIDSSVFSQNTALSNGGALWDNSGSTGQFPSYWPLSTHPITGKIEPPKDNTGNPCPGSLATGSDPLRAPTLRKSVFEKNAGFSGGALSYGYGMLEVLDCTFVGNTGSTSSPFASGGAIFGGGQVMLLGIQRCVFDKNVATQGGGIRLLAGETYIINSTFADNVAITRAGALWLDEAVVTKPKCLYVCQDIWDGPHAPANTAMYPSCTPRAPCEAVVTGTQFLRNTYHQSLYTGMAADIDPRCAPGETVSCCDKGQGGGAVTVTAQMALFSYCHFEGNKDPSVSKGGAAISTGSSPTILKTRCCNFTSNSAVHKGGAIHIDESKSSRIEDKGSTFNDNIAMLGGAMSITGQGVNANLTSSIFVRNTAGVPNKHTDLPSGGLGAAIYTGDGSVVNISKSLFKGHSAALRGTIHVRPFATASVQRSIFRENTATEYGGALSVDTAAKVQLSHIQCYDNTAQVAGGCIYWEQSDVSPSFYAPSCGPTDASHKSAMRVCHQCHFSANKVTRLCNGSALLCAYGPDLASDVKDVQPVLADTWGGTAPKGDGTGDAPGTMPPAENHESLASVMQLRGGNPLLARQQVSFRPGVRFDMYWQASDAFGQLVRSERNGLNLATFLEPDSKRNVGRMSMEFSGKPLPGLVSMGPIKVGAQVGNKYTWTAYSQWYRSGITLGVIKKVKGTAWKLDAVAQPCLPGEITLYDENPMRKKIAKKNNIPWDKVVSECQWCPAGTYVLNLRGEVKTKCHPCPVNGATCWAGGPFIKVTKGFWRAFPKDFIYKCPLNDPKKIGPAGTSPVNSCLGGYETPTKCLYGYKGPLCAQCIDGWSNTGTYCVDCSNVGMNGDMIALLLLVCVATLVGAKLFMDNFLNAGDIKGTKALKIMMKKKKMYARTKAILGQVKILVAYFQVIISFLDVGVPFPDVFQGLFMSFSFLNIDPVKNMRGVCIGNFDFYQTFLWNSFMPIAVAAVLAVHYFVTKPRDNAQAARKHSAFYWNSFCMLLFLIFPGTSKVVVSMFHCKQLQYSDSEVKEYLYADFNVQCWEGSHNMYAALAAVMVMLYPIGIPVFFIMSLYPHSRVTADGTALKSARQEEPDAQSALVKDPVISEQFGFLYARFKPDFWWYETSELVRKLAVGTLSMFIMPGTATQTVFAIGFNTYFMCQLLICWPFKAYDDNMLMTISLAATSITLFGALIIQGHIDELDQYGDGVTEGLLLGTTCTLFILYVAMICRFHLAFICNALMPAFISNSPINCFRPPPKAKPVASQGHPDKETAEKVLSQELLPPPPSPPPLAKLDMETEALDQLIIDYFHRYDLDESGTINSNEELKQLSTNLSFKLRLTLTGDEIDALVHAGGELDNENEWQVEEFGEWYKESFLGISEEGLCSLQNDAVMITSLVQNANMNQDLADDAGDGD